MMRPLLVLGLVVAGLLTSAQSAMAVGLSVSPGSVTPTTTATLTATGSSSTADGLRVRIYDVTDGGESLVGECGGLSCAVTVGMAWSENRSPKDRVYRAKQFSNVGYGGGEQLDGVSGAVTVAHHAVPMTPTLSAAPSAVTPMQTSGLEATVSGLSTLPLGYRLIVYDVTDGGEGAVLDCPWLPCRRTLEMAWEENLYPKDRVYVAKLFGDYGGPGGYLESQSAPVTIVHQSADALPVLTMSSSAADPTQSSLLTASMAAFSPLPFAYRLRFYRVTDAGDQYQGECATPTCSLSVLPADNGLYRAKVFSNVGWGGGDFLVAQSVPVAVGHYPGGAETFGPGGSEGATPNRGGCSEGQPVDCATGNQWEQQSDLSVEGLGGLDLQRTYNSQAASEPDAVEGPLGYGWTQRYRAWLSVDEGGLSAAAHLDDGSVLHYGRASAAGDWVAHAWNRARLVEHSEDTNTLVFPDGRSLRFEAGGRLAAIVDRDGNLTALTYDDDGDLSAVTAPSGREITFDYNSDGTVASATGPAGEHVEYGYEDGELVSVTGVDGHQWHYGYDGEHQLESMTDPRGKHTSTVYDADHRVTSQTQPGGGDYVWDWQPGGSVQITDPEGNKTDETFVHDQLVAITKGVGTTAERHSTFTYDLVGNLRARRDGRGSDWTYTYDAAGNRLTTTDPKGHTTTWTYNGDRDVTSITLPSGRKTIFDRDSAGHARSATIQDPAGANPKVTTFTYKPTGQLWTTTDPLSHTTTYSYDTNWDLTSIETPLGNTTTLAYDADGRVQSSVSARGNAAGATPAHHRTTYTRDEAGRVTSVADPNGHSTSTEFDGMGLATQITDAEGHQTQLEYDAEGQPTKVTRPDQTITTTGYDADERMVTQTDAQGHTTTYTRDSIGQVVAITDAANRTRHVSYDDNGNQRTSTDPEGRVTTITFDSANRPTSIHYSSGDPGDQEIHYNADSQVAWTTDDSGTTTNTYDTLGRVHSRTDANAKAITYTYDDDSQITKIAYPSLPGSSEGGDVTRSYDDDGNLASVTDWHNRTTSFTANADQQPETTTFPTASHEIDTSVYDHAGQLDSITDAAGSATLARFAYHHDDVGRVTQAATSGTALSGTEDYGFDSLGQLTGANDQTYGHSIANALTSLDGVTDATYDIAGQLTGATVDSGATTYSYDTNGQRTTSTPLNGGATTYDYDQAGDLSAVHPAQQSPTDAAGWYHGLAVDTDGTPHAWGLNNFGQVGDGTSTQAFPVTVTGLANITAVAAGAAHSLALNADGRVYSWGDNNYGQLGYAPGTGRSVPARIQGLSSIKQLSAGAFSSLALDTSGEVYSWGWNAHGQLADTTTTDNATPRHIAGLPAVKQIVSSYKNGFALDTSGGVWGWGANDQQQLSPTATTTDRLTPIQILGLPANITQIACEQDFAIALDATGHIWFWGLSSGAPYQLPGISDITQISAGGTHMLALDSTGHVHVLGDNSLGQAGNGTTTSTSGAWTQVPGISTATAVSAGVAHSYALQADGTIKAWGYNNEGETGNGQTATIVTTPVAVDGLTLQIPQHTSTYTYDADGLRTSKTIGTTTTRYTWETQTNSLPLMLADTTHQYIYGPGDQPIEQIAADGSTTYLHQDQLGSTRLITNPNGTVAGTATYTPYGNVASQTGATSALGYAGQYTDPDTGLIHMRARDYDPATGQFLTRDPIEALTRDAYGYAGADPIDNIDPSGLDWLSDGVNFVAGAGDTLTYGGTSAIRQAIGNDNVDYCSSSYTAGGIAGMAAGVIIPGEGEVLATALAAKVAQVERFGKSVKASDATAAWEKFLGPGAHTDIHPRLGTSDPNRIVSADGTRSIRMGRHEMNSSPNKFHYHEETWVHNTTNTWTVANVLRRITP